MTAARSPSGPAERRAADGAAEGAIDRLLALELLLVLPAAGLLVLREWVPPSVQTGAVVWILALGLLRLHHEGRWRRTALDLPALLLLASLPGAIWVAGDRQAALSRALSLLAGLGLAHAIARAPRRRRQAWHLAGLLLLGGLALVALALVGVGWLSKLPLLGPLAARLPQLIRQVPHASLGTLEGTQAAAIHPNSVAGLLILFLPLALGCLAACLHPWPPQTAAPPPAWLRPLALALLLGGGTVLLLTQSRGAWLALGLALLLMVLRRRPAAWRGAGLLLLLGGLGVAVVLGRDGGIPSEGAGSMAMRLRLWQEGLVLWWRQPFLGIGLNNFLQVHGLRQEYGGAFVYQGFPHVHNLYLQAALDYGLLGLLGLGALLVGLARAARRSLARLQGQPLAGLALGLAFGLLAHALHGLVDSVSLGSKAGIVPWAFAGLLAGVDRLAARERVGEQAEAGQGAYPAA